MSVLGRKKGGAGWWKVKGEGSLWGEENVMNVQVKDELPLHGPRGWPGMEIILILMFFML